MSLVSIPSEKGVEQRPADSVQIRLPEQSPQIEAPQGTIVFDANKEAGVPDFSALVERTERERQIRLGEVRMLLGEVVREKVKKQAKTLDEVYYRSQAKAFGFQLPLDPSRANGVTYPVPEDLRREDFKSNEEFEVARSDQADALSSQEKNALQGVPLN